MNATVSLTTLGAKADMTRLKQLIVRINAAGEKEKGHILSYSRNHFLVQRLSDAFLEWWPRVGPYCLEAEGYDDKCENCR